MGRKRKKSKKSQNAKSDNENFEDKNEVGFISWDYNPGFFIRPFSQSNHSIHENVSAPFIPAR